MLLSPVASLGYLGEPVQVEVLICKPHATGRALERKILVITSFITGSEVTLTPGLADSAALGAGW